MVVGIDVHKRAHVAALLDERGGELGTLSFANSPAGTRKRRTGWSPTMLARRSSASRVRPATAGSLSLRSRRRGTRCSTCPPGVRTGSAAGTGRARPTPAKGVQTRP